MRRERRQTGGPEEHSAEPGSLWQRAPRNCGWWVRVGLASKRQGDNQVVNTDNKADFRDGADRDPVLDEYSLKFEWQHFLNV